MKEISGSRSHFNSGIHQILWVYSLQFVIDAIVWKAIVTVGDPLVATIQPNRVASLCILYLGKNIPLQFQSILMMILESIRVRTWTTATFSLQSLITLLPLSHTIEDLVSLPQYWILCNMWRRREKEREKEEGSRKTREEEMGRVCEGNPRLSNRTQSRKPGRAVNSLRAYCWSDCYESLWTCYKRSGVPHQWHFRGNG